MVAPYITGIPPHESLSDFADFLASRECKWEIITGKPDAGSGALSKADADMMVVRGVHLLIRSSPFVHAKMYQFDFLEGDRAAFVGSANFTVRGFEKNDEIVAFSSEKCYNDNVAREFTRLAALGSIEYHLWKAKVRVL